MPHAESSPAAALQGLRVVECATVIAAPSIGKHLADFGADVIHIEHPGTGDHLRHFGFAVDGVNPWWAYYARNKRLVTLDVSKREGRTLLLRLLEDADIFVENFRPGRMEAWGITWEELSARNPRLVMVRVSGYGQDGPYASQPGFGSLMEAMSGFAEMTGEPDGPPTLPQFALADTCAGFYGAMAAMFAVYNRDVAGTGLGQVVDVSIWESLFSSMGPNALVHALTGTAPTRMGNAAPTTAPRNVYRTRDERWIVISGSTQSTALRLFAVMGRPELGEDPRFADNMSRVANAAALDAIIGAWTRSHDRDDLAALLRAHDVPVGPVFDVADIAADPHAIARRMIVEAPGGDGRALPMEGVFPRLARTPGTVRHAGREKGADNAAVYGGELGLSAEELARLAEAGVI